MIEILEQAIELYEKDRKERKKVNKENVAPKVSLEEFPEVRKNKRPFMEISNEETESSSKKRKISE